jgi:ABC-type oligopeptide transport system substrate-binding subunit
MRMRRQRGYLPAQATTAVVYRAAGIRLVAGLSLPRAAGVDAAASDRHRTVQIRRVRAARVDKVARNPDYWKPGLLYLDGIEHTFIRNTSTAILTLAAGRLDRTWPGIVPIALMREIKGQAPQIECEINAWNIPRLLIINRDKPPFNNPELRRALALSIDRKAFIDILSDGRGDIGATMLPAPEGVWGVPPDMLKTFPGYDPDIAKNRVEAPRSWRSSVMAPTTSCRSRLRAATYLRIATRRC